MTGNGPDTPAVAASRTADCSEKLLRRLTAHRTAALQVVMSRNSVRGILGQNTVRVATPIQSLNLVSRIVVTQSGRRYYLDQAPTTEIGMVAAMRLHAFDHHVVVTRDVSDQHWALMQESIQ